MDNLGGAELEDKAEEAFCQLGRLLNEIGIEESKIKAMPPAFAIVFLGILVNSLLMTLEITQDRRRKIKVLLDSWVHQKSVTIREAQSILGKLSFVCSTVRAGRVFLARIIEEITKFPQRGRRRLSANFKKDIRWWQEFMLVFDGISMIPEDWSSPDEVVAMDASLKRCGGWAKPYYFSKNFPVWIKQDPAIHINELELVSFMIALKLWRNWVRNHNVLAYCDNQCTVEVIN